MRNIRWGIIGCGDVTEVKSGPGFQKATGSELAAVMRRTGHLAKDYAARHGVANWYDDALALIADPLVDAVYVATPPSSHKDYTLLAAQAGKPVYVEKPMAMNHAECMEMVKSCERAGVPLFIAYYRRALPRFVKIKELVDDGAIGEVRFVNINLYRPASPSDADPKQNWRVDPAVSSGGYFPDMASHMLDFLDYVLGPIAEVNGFAGNQAGLYAAEDIVTGSFRFESGVQGTGMWCFSAYDKRDWTEIVGTKGKIGYATFDESPVVLTTSIGTESFAIPNPPHVHQPLIQSIVDELNGNDNGICPSRGESAARTSWVMDQMLKAYYARN
ncbi:MAG TPA: Gfo/Idh/MocA family oxidoreductase [Rhodocyclaceae bacterium]|nr:Gfo/Idh/MocA family oxidoreductase [Rhodocyclaceae bacterium]